MGGPGSGGYKNAPGDTETHSAWDILPQDSDSGQVSHDTASPTVHPCCLAIMTVVLIVNILEIGPGTMQVLCSRNGTAHVSPASSLAHMRAIP